MSQEQDKTIEALIRRGQHLFATQAQLDKERERLNQQAVVLAERQDQRGQELSTQITALEASVAIRDQGWLVAAAVASGGGGPDEILETLDRFSRAAVAKKQEILGEGKL